MKMKNIYFILWNKLNELSGQSNRCTGYCDYKDGDKIKAYYNQCKHDNILLQMKQVIAKEKINECQTQYSSRDQG